MGAVKKMQQLKQTSLPNILINEPGSLPSPFPFIVIMPLAKQREWSPQFPQILSLLTTLLPSVNGDSSRIYATGNSMGGKGVWEVSWVRLE